MSITDAGNDAVLDVNNTPCFDLASAAGDEHSHSSADSNGGFDASEAATKPPSPASPPSPAEHSGPTPGRLTGFLRWVETDGVPHPEMQAATEEVLTKLPDTEVASPELAKKLAKAGQNDSGEELLSSLSTCTAATSKSWHLVRTYAEGVGQEIVSMRPAIENLHNELVRRKQAIGEYTSITNGTFKDALSAGNLGKSIPLLGWLVGFVVFLFLDFRIAASYVVLDNPERVTDIMTGRIDYLTALGVAAPFVLGPFACIKAFFSRVSPEVFKQRFQTLCYCGLGVLFIVPVVYAVQTGGVLDLVPVGGISIWEIALGTVFNLCSLVSAIFFTTIASLKADEHFRLLLDIRQVRTASYKKLAERVALADHALAACDSIALRAKLAIASADAAARHLDTAYRIEIGSAQASIDAAKAQAFASN